MTVAVVNQVMGTGPSSALFQMGFTVTAAEGLVIEPYPEVELPDRDDEEQSIDLLYRHKRTYAIGHGCAAEWDEAVPDHRAAWVQAVALPAYEVVSLTPNIYRTDRRATTCWMHDGHRQAVTVSMKALAEGTDEGTEQVETVLDALRGVDRSPEAEIADLLRSLPARRESAHEARGRDALKRMQAGWELVGTERHRDAGRSAGQTRPCSTSRCAPTSRCARSSAARTTSSERWARTRALRPTGQRDLAPLPDRLHPRQPA